MLKLRNEYTDDEMLLLIFAATAGEPVDPEAVLGTLNRLFVAAEYDDHEEYAINTAGVVPNKPGPERDKMWAWLERIEKRLGIEVEVWGSDGEYLTPTTLNGSSLSPMVFMSFSLSCVAMGTKPKRGLADTRSPAVRSDWRMFGRRRRTRRRAAWRLEYWR